MTQNPVKIWAKGINRHFSNVESQVASIYMKSCSGSLVLRKMQIKVRVSFYPPLVEWPSSHMPKQSMLVRTLVKSALHNCWWEYKLVRPLLKKNVDFSEIWEQIYHMTQPFYSGNLSKWINSAYDRVVRIFMFLVTQFTLDKTWSLPRSSSTGDGIKKMFVYRHFKNTSQLLKK